ncbi:chorismate-binding protein [Gryllotalpicola protaetiae]|uniref:anthranilate synthase n=1 Tax=Gryllotalpicola protaetiae TaxID=2419771 RepID=A0A387BXK1_9MICO|nr:chorismate-binding protein [Gryllotalpicola protaetiae]AYG03081.1 chorismate-binding protein [Gryllotalpicola protaetiae]
MDHPLLTRIAASDGALPFALLRREGSPDVEVLTGEVVDVDALADIPLDGRPVLSAVPFRQVRERGFAAHDDGAPLRCLVVTESERMPLDAVLELLPDAPAHVDAQGFDVPDEEYAEIVRRVIADEIGRGEGSNFVIKRSFVGHTDAPTVPALLSWFRALLTDESGAYWTFAVGLDDLRMVGATPERHLSVQGDVAMMNPISGTYRHPADGPTHAGALGFLADVKESEELFMVVDEEMKMMSAVCPEGGRILGPYLKQMSRLSHTEYLLEGRTSLDLREALRLTMFAPTVTGSPMQNACAVIARHEPKPRGYYAGVLAFFETSPSGYSLDAPILIRTAYLEDGGRLTVPAGATLVRHSTPEGEVAETHAKASGVLAALGLLPRQASAAALDLNAQPGVADALAARNERLASFWVRPQATDASAAALAGRTALVVDNEDQFTTMLAHQLRHLGLEVRIAPWAEVDSVGDHDLVVFGPGPGDPRDLSDRRIARLRALMLERLRAGAPLLAVCLSHQVLAELAGYELAPLPAPRQGVRLEVDVFGEPAAIGFYNTFGARAPRSLSRSERRETIRPEVELEASVDPDGVVTALRGPGVASIQGHLESVLSSDGYATLLRLVEHALVPAPARV